VLGLGIYASTDACTIGATMKPNTSRVALVVYMQRPLAESCHQHTPDMYADSTLIALTVPINTAILKLA
jgi:hypothetical protein